MPGQAGNIPSKTSLRQDQRLQPQAAKACSPGSFPCPKRATLATPAQASQHCQQLQQRTPATAQPPFQQPRLDATSPADAGATHIAPQPEEAETPLEESVTLADDDVLGNGSAADAQLAEADSEPISPVVCPEPLSLKDVIDSAVVRVKVWQAHQQKQPRGQSLRHAAKQSLSPQLAHLVALLCEAEAQQRSGLTQTSSRYCQFLQLREYWYRLLGEQARQLQQHASKHTMAALATLRAVLWIQDIQQSLGVLSPADYLNQHADVHSSLLPEPSLSPAATVATDSGSQAATGSKHEDVAMATEVAHADQQQDTVIQDPHPFASMDLVDRAFHQSPLLSTEQSVSSSVWAEISPMSECGCMSCLAWQSGKQPPITQTRDCRPYCSLPVGASTPSVLPFTDEQYVSQLGYVDVLQRRSDSLHDHNNMCGTALCLGLLYTHMPHTAGPQ